jgi:hypothetical protein
MGDDEVSESEYECYDIAWFDEDGGIDLKSLAVVVLSAAFALNQKEFDSLAGFYASAQGSAHDILWKRFCDIDHEITGQAYRRQLRRMYHQLDPYVRGILEDVKEHHDRIMRAKLAARHGHDARPGPDRSNKRSNE